VETLPPIAVVLAGGASRRMGRDKSSVEIAGTASLDRVVAAARQALSEVVVVGGGAPGALADLEPGGGPVQAILSAWRAHPGRALVVLGCDMPFVGAELVARLATVRSTGDATLVRAGGRAQPLCARYEPEAAAAFERAFAAQRRGLMRVVADLEVGWIDEAELPAAERLGARDFDTPEELARLLDDAQRGAGQSSDPT